MNVLIILVPTLSVWYMQYNWTPLFLAAWGGHVDVVKYLLKDANCDVKIRDVVSEALYAVPPGYTGHLPLYLLSCFAPAVRMDVTCSLLAHGVATWSL